MRFFSHYHLNAGFGGVDNKGGDVFLSTFVSYGCSSGYYGAQMHWNTMKMSLDWEMCDSGPAAPVGDKLWHGQARCKLLEHAVRKSYLLCPDEI